jgi:hypothetical protein
LGFGGLYERYLASQTGFADDPQAYRAVAIARRREISGLVRAMKALARNR